MLYAGDVPNGKRNRMGKDLWHMRGIDVHKKLLVACLNRGNEQEVREFGASTREILEMLDWLMKNLCEIVAMESTGSYWKPLHNILEACGMPAIVVNAQHMKAVLGRKTNVNDAQWIANLLQHGLLRDMGGTFDHFGIESHPDWCGNPETMEYTGNKQPKDGKINEVQFKNRMILRQAMLRHGFKPLSTEWWHFTLKNEPYPETYFTFPPHLK